MKFSCYCQNCLKNVLNVCETMSKNITSKVTDFVFWKIHKSKKDCGRLLFEKKPFNGRAGQRETVTICRPWNSSCQQDGRSRTSWTGDAQKHLSNTSLQNIILSSGSAQRVSLAPTRTHNEKKLLDNRKNKTRGIHPRDVFSIPLGFHDEF